MVTSLKVENIKIGYGKELVIDDISFQMKNKEFTALLGLNGAGKTTLLRSISGLLRPKSGRCLLSNVDIYDYTDKERARNISYMPQRHSICYHIKVLDLVLMGITPYLGIFSSPNKGHREIAYDILKKMGIDKLAHDSFLNLSEGQKQIVTIARNLMQDSRIMLFDEPDSALDFNNRHMVISKIKDVVKEQEKIGIITLHDPNIALKYCDRIVIIKDKKILTDFYTKEVDIEFLTEIFNKVYNNIVTIKHEDKYMVIR